MPETRICSFTREEIEPGTGIMFVRRDGTVLCQDSKARKNHVNLNRNPRRPMDTKIRERRHQITPFRYENCLHLVYLVFYFTDVIKNPTFSALSMDTLITIPGIGESLSKRLINELGSEDEVLRIIKNKDVASLSKIDGLSTSRAVRIINEFGGSGKSIAQTTDIQKLHNRLGDIEAHILQVLPRKDWASYN